ncbi:actin-like protein [Strigomonas culicis]|uniref:Actin-like protein n=3 Tax=Strigomonas culicis TaxID=28005 RepID=S9TXX7_9TRYP|nr:actin-like protein [Strigomonas culicis]|eukprot:EPY21454.1 actin-like protein [Strigomonas culicis]
MYNRLHAVAIQLSSSLFFLWSLVPLRRGRRKPYIQQTCTTPPSPLSLSFSFLYSYRKFLFEYHSTSVYIIHTLPCPPPFFVLLVHVAMKVAPNTAKILRNVPLPNEAAVTYTNPAVLDIGGHSTRLGFAGDNAPRFCERTVVQKSTGRVFNDAYAESDAADLAHVMEDGYVTDWDHFELLVQRVDDMLVWGDTDHNTPLLLTEKALLPNTQRQKMAEILYEKFNVPALSFGLSPVLALYAAGLSTGVSVELGYSLSHVVPVFQGVSLFHSIHCLSLGGRDLTELLRSKSRAQLPASVAPQHHTDVWAYLKEKCGRTAEGKDDYNALVDLGAGGSDGDIVVEQRLPDGTVLGIGPECYTPVETFFQPHLLPRMKELPDQSNILCEVQLRTSTSSRGIHELLADSVKRCDADLQPLMWDSVVLSGGSSLFRGLATRLEVEASVVSATSERVRVVAPTERKESAFIGGSILASLPTFQDLWVKRSDYDETGSMSVVRGCL